MSVVDALLLGLIQGLTEFLPISSSGHLVIVQQLLGLEENGTFLLSFDLALHFGTLLAVLAVFYRDIGMIIAGSLRWLVRNGSCRLRHPFSCGQNHRSKRMARATRPEHPGPRWAFLLLIGTIPAAVIGLTLKDFFESLFTQAAMAAVMLLVTGAVLWLTRFVKKNDRKLSGIRAFDALLVGLAQAVAILPGISRSGMTIATGLFRHWDPELTARFSFLLAVPAILGAMLVEIGSFQTEIVEVWPALLVGTGAAAVSGFFAIHTLLHVVRRGRLSLFAYYCWLVGAVTLIWFS